MRFLQLVFLVTSISISYSTDEEYYWREYTGHIPSDAIKGGKDGNNKPIFIGQAYSHGEGLIVVEISPERREVFAPFGGISKKIESGVKILCGVQANFVWTPVNGTHLHLQLINKRPVIGGRQVEGVLYIGRISSEGSTKIGKVASFYADARMYYNVYGIEKDVESYEILLFEEYYNGLDIRADN